MTEEELAKALLNPEHTVPELGYDECIFNALGCLSSALDYLRQAEALQSKMDPIRGPGTREWELLSDEIAMLEGDIRLANDEPGALETMFNKYIPANNE